MKKIIKILILYILLVIFNFNSGYSQNIGIQADSAGMRQNMRDKGPADGKHKENRNNNNNKQQPIKKIKAARPDMTKARGARPAYIQRQAGSGIPRGIGRPGGAGGIKPGKR